MKLVYLKNLFTLVWQYGKALFLLSTIIKIILGISPLATLFIVQEVINQVTELIQGESVEYMSVLFLLLLQFAVSVLISILNHVDSILAIHLEVRLDYKISKKVSTKSITVPFSYFELSQFYDHQNRIKNGNIGTRLMIPIKATLDVLKYIISISSYVIFLATIHWGLVVISLIAFIPILIIKAKFGSAKFYLMRNQTPAAREANYITSLLNTRQASKEIRLFRLGEFLLQKWSFLFKKNNSQTLRLARREYYAFILIDLFSALLYVAASLLLISQISRGFLAVGQFVSTGQAIQGAQSTINMIASTLARIYENQLYVEDLFKYLNYYEPTLHKNNEQEKTMSFPSKVQKGINVGNLSFYYPHSSKKALHNISFSVKPGEKIAIVGENGSGKSTLVKCLMGLYNNYEGTITIDDIDIQKIKTNELYDQMTGIFQDYMKYQFTVQENIGFGNISKLDQLQQIINTSEKSGADSFVRNLPKQYSSRLGRLFQGGYELSGGQWQKIALARALYKNAQIIFLDEPTASLDPLVEIELFRQFLSTTKDVTTFYISHRMASAKVAEKILVLKNGEIVESGSHTELMNLQGEYHRMYQAQANWYLEKDSS
ncbi:ABC transporter ATP-binding protein [Bacillus horti]|uniref:ABC transport system ATP-binding protein/ATP-binding cassette subfamily B protein n=1 Tax=Caldalkalibacillus horti TaxID=77523 RepID=A0ABT9W324_9BACI|nr:ABC transporter ATP-binding protein [Bacillus horti]MDQ0167637.1 putative ABC transport system ATP-binding protein/ATP-binding cassette subfamily B protein [Bacillus horti]